MVIVFNPGDGGSGGPFPPGPRPPYKPPAGKSPIKGTPGLITSTGGLNGANYELLMPLFDAIPNKPYLALIDPGNNNTEDDAFYIFRQEDVAPSKVVSVHKVIVYYKELGAATFSVGVQVYVRKANKFMQISRQVQIKKRIDPMVPFPDGKLRELPVDLVIEGERPQVFIARNANSGPLAITRVHVIGHADEKEIV